MKKVKPLIETGPLEFIPGHSLTSVKKEGWNFICRHASEWLNPKAKTGCRFAVFKRPVKGSRRVFLRDSGGFVTWGKTGYFSRTVFPRMESFLRGLSLPTTSASQQFFVRLK